MKIHLSLIPEEGLEKPVRLPLSAMTRLAETIGAQSGEITGFLVLKNREGHIEVTGHLRADLLPPCQRCLAPVPLPLDEEVRLALAPLESYDDAPEDARLGAGDLEVGFYDGEELDLARIVEEELLLLIPDLIVEEDENEQCVICGKRMDEIFSVEPDTEDLHPFAKMKEFLTEE